MAEQEYGGPVRRASPINEFHDEVPYRHGGCRGTARRIDSQRRRGGAGFPLPTSPIIKPRQWPDNYKRIP
jgi:hypothetical protein